MNSCKAQQAAPLLRDGVPAPRLPYEKPVLRSISLVADQVLGYGCKQLPPAGGLPLGTYPALGCIANACKTVAGS